MCEMLGSIPSPGHKRTIYARPHPLEFFLVLPMFVSGFLSNRQKVEGKYRPLRLTI